ncbi:uncharacterized protein BXZ73DRAFT_82661 [Epithele typhae]|uniref:uncharacterized protein n=1 Tax=Epithele typhae TaxID=378194 RepID=UPI002008C2E7|nr:uncharacterized protein BXZ73DRAFT_82661 [Epithele typhae]KAH9911669.1 hypothetical protein BXZ73DRAFT_82661 [Epithele typhae]
MGEFQAPCVTSRFWFMKVQQMLDDKESVHQLREDPHGTALGAIDSMSDYACFASDQCYQWTLNFRGNSDVKSIATSSFASFLCIVFSPPTASHRTSIWAFMGDRAMSPFFRRISSLVSVANIEPPSSLPLSMMQPGPSSPASPEALPVVPKLDNTYGAVLVATFVGLIVYGISFQQAQHYFRRYWSDSLFVKLLRSQYFQFNRVYASVVNQVHYTDKRNVEVWAATVLLGQTFYARRVFLLGGWYRHVAVLVAILMMGCFEAHSQPNSCRHLTIPAWEPFTWMTSAAFGFSLGTDVLLSLTLLVFLRTNRTGFERYSVSFRRMEYIGEAIIRTDSFINILTVYTINTVFPLHWGSSHVRVSILSISCLVLALVLPDNLVYAAVVFPTVKCYVTSVLAVYAPVELSGLHAQGRVGVRLIWQSFGEQPCAYHFPSASLIHGACAGTDMRPTYQNVDVSTVKVGVAQSLAVGEYSPRTLFSEVKPGPESPHVYAQPIPGTEYSLRLFPGSYSSREWGMYFVETDTGRPGVNSPFPFGLWMLAHYTFPLQGGNVGPLRSLDLSLRPAQDKIPAGRRRTDVRTLPAGDVHFDAPIRPAVSADGSSESDYV